MAIDILDILTPTLFTFEGESEIGGPNVIDKVNFITPTDQVDFVEY